MAAHIAELEADKSEIEAELSGVEKALKAFKEIDTAQLDEELEVYAETAAKISQDKKEIQSKINKIQNNAVMLQRHHKTLGELKADLKEIESRKPPKVAEYIKDHKAKLKKLEKDIKANKAALENARELAARLKVLKNGWKAVKGYVFQGVLDELTRKANRYLADLFEIPVSIEFSTVLDNKGIPKIKDTVRYGDEERPFHAFSGGQSRRIQLAVDFSLSEVIAARGSKSIPLMILDEAFKDLSSESMEKIVGLLEHRKGPTIIVEHNPVLKNIVAKSFKVELRDGVSSHAT